MIKRILLMLKLDEPFERCFTLAMEMAQNSGAHLHIIHVLENQLRAQGVTGEQATECIRAAEARFKKTYLPLLKDFKRFAFNCWEGDPASETARFAAEIRADLLIVGCHKIGGRASFNRLGEVGSAIVQWAPCPVLVVPCANG